MRHFSMLHSAKPGCLAKWHPGAESEVLNPAADANRVIELRGTDLMAAGVSRLPPASNPRFGTVPAIRTATFGIIPEFGVRSPALMAVAIMLFAVLRSPAFVSENAFELQSDGDFNGDARRDLLIVDRATGNYRIGYRQVAGDFIWASARASGIAPVTGLGIGRLNTVAFDSLAFTGPAANRVNILDADAPGTAGLPWSYYPPSLGPNMVVAMDIGGAGTNTFDDLYITSLHNGVPPFRETLVRTVNPTTRTTLVDVATTALCERGNRILLHTNQPPRLALFRRNVAAATDQFALYDLGGGTAAMLAAANTSNAPQPWDFVAGQFIPANPYTQVLLFPPTGWYFYVYQVSEPVPGVFALNYTTNFSLPAYIAQMFVLPGAGGGKLLVLETNGVTATLYDFDGVSAPVAVQSLNAAAGEHFTGAGVTGDGGFIAYSAPLGQTTSARFSQWQWNGGTFTNRSSGDLPPVSSYSGSGNVMQFQFEPFVTNNPTLLRLNNAGDWSSAPSYSGSPGNISVQTETFLNATQGLANPAPVSLGAAHPLAAFGLANQYRSVISLFSFTPPAGDKISDVSISPPAGHYLTSVKLGFTAANPGDTIFFRAGTGAWLTWSNNLVFRLFTNSTVQYYGQSAGDAKSAIKSATYSFAEGASTLDSDGDGVPDYVEIALGLDPRGGRDSDGDGYSDLEELIRNKDPLSAGSVPTNWPHLDERAVFDLRVKPFPWDGFANAASLCATGTAMRVLDLQGSLLSVGSVATNTWPFSWLSNVTIVAGDRLVVHSTDLHYDILTTNTDTTVGRELLGLTPVPALTLPAVPYGYGGGAPSTEALNWILAASNTLNNLPRATLISDLTTDSTLCALLFEQKAAQLLGARGNVWWTNLTLFPLRVSDAGRTNPPQPQLLALEQATNSLPGHKLQTLFAGISNQIATSASPSVADLRAVTRDIYRISSRLNNTNPATFASPVDELRRFLWRGDFDSNYLAACTTSNLFNSASNGAALILAAAIPRSTTNVVLVVRPDTLGPSCRILDKQGGGTFALQDSTGLPFGFPDSFQLLPGAVVQVTGYTDVTNVSCAYPAIEVTSVLLNSVPRATDNDDNGNLLVDSWEKKFFGYIGVADPFGDADGDGYQNVQELLDGSDPRDLYGVPPGPVVNFQLPVLTLSPAGGWIELWFQWPAAYIGRFNFGVRHATDLTTPFTSLAATGPTYISGNQFKMTIVPPGTSQHFYVLTIALP